MVFPFWRTKKRKLVDYGQPEGTAEIQWTYSYLIWLQIRFPFGRKGKDKDKNKKGVQLPDHDLTPVGERTPANEDVWASL